MAELRTVRWTVDGYAFAGGRGDARSVAQYAAGAPVRLLVPSEDVLLTAVDLPARNRRDRLRALPFALEERVCADADTLHYAPGDAAPGAALPVAVVARGRMDAWLDPLTDHGVAVASMLPDCLALPWTDGAWHVRGEAGRMLVRTGPAAGCALDGESAAGVFRRLLREAPPGTVRFDQGPDPEALKAVAVECGWTLADAAVAAAGSAASPPALDLRQGRYAPADHARGWGAWRLAAALLAASLVVHAGLSYARAARLEAETLATRAANEAQYRRLFPETKRIVDLRVQSEQQLALRRAAQSGDDAFLRMFYASGLALSTLPGQSLTEVAYAGGVLELGVVVADLALLEEYARRLAGQRLQAEILGATRGDAGVAGRVRIRELRP